MNACPTLPMVLLPSTARLRILTKIAHKILSIEMPPNAFLNLHMLLFFRDNDTGDT